MESEENEEKEEKNWCGFQHTSLLSQNDHLSDMKRYIILDNGSTVDLFSNRDFVTNVKTSNQAMELHTNSGSKINRQKADIPGYGEVWYDQDAIANIFSLKNLLKGHHVDFNSRKENEFNVENKKTGKRLNLVLTMMDYIHLHHPRVLVMKIKIKTHFLTME